MILITAEISFLRMVFPSAEPVTDQVRKEFGKSSEGIRKEFGVEVLKTFEIIVKNPKCTAEEIAAEICKTSRTVEKYISKLKEGKYIERQGLKLGGYWKIIRKNQ